MSYTGLHFSLTLDGGNWTLRSTCSQFYYSLTLDSVRFTIRTDTGLKLSWMSDNPLSNLTQENWRFHWAAYQKVGDEDYVRENAVLIASASVYPAGYRYEFTARYDTAYYDTLASGTFG